MEQGEGSVGVAARSGVRWNRGGARVVQARGAKRGARYAAASFVPARVMLGGAGCRLVDLGAVGSEVGGVVQMVWRLPFPCLGLRSLSAIVWPPAPIPADVSPSSASHVSIRALEYNSLSGTMPIELGSLASMNYL